MSIAEPSGKAQREEYSVSWNPHSVRSDVRHSVGDDVSSLGQDELPSLHLSSPLSNLQTSIHALKLKIQSLKDVLERKQASVSNLKGELRQVQEVAEKRRRKFEGQWLTQHKQACEEQTRSANKIRIFNEKLLGDIAAAQRNLEQLREKQGGYVEGGVYRTEYLLKIRSDCERKLHTSLRQWEREEQTYLQKVYGERHRKQIEERVDALKVQVR
ncbi:hypothetical protein EON63_08955 [archaeon]|nr:MAG: hypothetical protein EON63_08955 [archaeon]